MCVWTGSEQVKQILLTQLLFSTFPLLHSVSIILCPIITLIGHNRFIKKYVQNPLINVKPEAETT